jgi:hypothetical protein
MKTNGYKEREVQKKIVRGFILLFILVMIIALFLKRNPTLLQQEHGSKIDRMEEQVKTQGSENNRK